jgi:hypothetical protein
MRIEMFDLALFLFAIAKASLLTGILPGMFLAGIVECKYHRFARWAEKFSASRKAARHALVRLDYFHFLLVAHSRVLGRFGVGEKAEAAASQLVR